MTDYEIVSAPLNVVVSAGNNKRNVKKSAKLSYDAANTNRHNRGLWENADNLAVKDFNSASVRKTLLSRARYESQNSPYVKNITRVGPVFLVGKVPHLNVTENEERTDLAVAINRAWIEWCRYKNFGRKLRVLDEAAMRDGEGFAIIVESALGEEDELMIPKFDVLLVATERMTSSEFGDNIVDGLSIDPKSGYVKSYTLKDGQKEQKIDAKYVLHWFYQDYPEQYRQVPELTAGLQLHAQLRSYTTSQVKTAQNIADRSMYIVADDMTFDDTVIGQVSESDEQYLSAFESLSVDERDAMYIMPPGWEPKFAPNNFPAPAFSDFHDSVVTIGASGTGTPLNLATGNSRGYNYASARMDHLTYSKKREVDQYDLSCIILDKVAKFFIKGMLDVLKVPETKYLELDWDWQFDVASPADEFVAAKAAAARLEAGVTSEIYEAQRFGVNPWIMASERHRYKSYLAELGLVESNKGEGVK